MTIVEHNWVILDGDEILARFPDEDEAYEATMTGEYPDDVEVAYISDPYYSEGEDE